MSDMYVIYTSLCCVQGFRKFLTSIDNDVFVPAHRTVYQVCAIIALLETSVL